MLEPEAVYHIYNCANGDENLFREERNYWFFLEKYFKYTHPVAKTYAFCLLKNHFHAMVRIRNEEEVVKMLDLNEGRNLAGFKIQDKVGARFKNLFISYAKSFNKLYNRRGSLFNPNMKKKEVISESYFTQMILYIHNNPVNHGFVSSPYDWPYSSVFLFVDENTNNEKIEYLRKSGYVEKLGNFKKFIDTGYVLDWFGGLDGFLKAHE